MDGEEPDPGPAEFTSRRLTRRSWKRPGGALVALGAALVLVALLSKGGSPPARPSAPPPSVPAAAEATAVSSSSARPLPHTIECHGLELTSCMVIVRAALASLPGGVPEVTTASAWGSLLCDSTIDCPPGDLRAVVPRGSVVLSFADGGPEAWLNVVDRPTPGGRAPVTQAWIVRWERVALQTPSAAPTR